MSLSPAQWLQVSRLFDELSGLAPEQRAERLAQPDLDPEVAQWLERMLAAGDADDDSILDATLSELVGSLAWSQGEPAGEMPDDLEGASVGNWRLGPEVARGAMATLHRGERADGEYRHRVAIKLLQPGPFTEAERQRMRDELGLLAGLEHSGIARLIDGGVTEAGWPFLVMEYVDGCHIDEWCRKGGASLEERIGLLIRAAEAVGYAHGKLVVHADIKPSNVLVSRQGEVKLVDFGIAGWLTSSTEVATHGPELLLRCSPAYAAPEQIRGERPTVAQDVFSLGAMSFELLTGSRIRDAAAVTDVVIGRAPKSDFPPPSSVAGSLVAGSPRRGDLDAILARALTADPEARYRTAEAFAEDLRRCLDDYPVSARPATTGYRLGRWFRRNRVGAAIGVVAAFGLSAAAVFSTWQAGLARAEAARAEAVTGFVLEIFESADPFANRQRPITANELVARQAGRIDALFAERPRIRRQLRRAMAEVQGNLGNHEEALSLFRQALDEAPAGLARAERAELHLGASMQLKELGRPDEALAQARRAGELVPMAEAPSRLAVEVVREQASVLAELRRRPDSRQLLESALAHRDRIAALPDGEALVGHLLADLTEIWGIEGDRERALAMADEALSLYAGVYPETHPEVIMLISRMAGIHRAAGDFAAAAEASYTAALRSRERLGPAHTRSLRSDAALAVDLAYLGCIEQAVALNSAMMPRYRATFGADNVLTAGALLNLASMRRKVGQEEQALAEIDETLAIYAAQPEPATDIRAFALGTKAQLLFALERTEEALAASRDAVAAMRDAVGADHPRAARVRVAHGEMLRRAGRLAPAREALEQAYAALRDKVGPESAHTRDAATKLAAVHLEAGREEDYRRLIDEAGIDEAEVAPLLSGLGYDTPAAAASAGCALPPGIDRNELAALIGS